jgi:hypothetical protein
MKREKIPLPVFGQMVVNDKFYHDFVCPVCDSSVIPEEIPMWIPTMVQYPSDIVVYEDELGVRHKHTTRRTYWSWRCDNKHNGWISALAQCTAGSYCDYSKNFEIIVDRPGQAPPEFLKHRCDGKR